MSTREVVTNDVADARYSRRGLASHAARYDAIKRSKGGTASLDVDEVKILAV